MKGAFKSKSSKGTKKGKKSKMGRSKPKVSEPVKSYVKQMLSKNVEEKYQSSPIGSETAIVYNNGAVIEFGVNHIGNVFDEVEQGVGQGQRIGNEITIKKWIVRGTVVPSGDLSTVIQNTSIGTLDLYIGYRRDFEQVPNNLDQFYQDGNTSFPPTGEFTDHLYYVNNDLYVILKHWRVKLGPAQNTTSTSNNDYQLTFDFSYDLCKKAFKNYRVKYTDTQVDPTDLKLNSIAVFGTWTSINGQDITILNPEVSNTGVYSFVTLEHLEYQDA